MKGYEKGSVLKPSAIGNKKDTDEVAKTFLKDGHQKYKRPSSSIRRVIN